MATASTSSLAGSTDLLNRLEQASELAQRKDFPLELLDELHSTLQNQADELTSGTKDIDDTVFSDPFPLLNFLLPLLSHAPSSLLFSNSAKASLLLLAVHSSGKEIAMACGEKLDDLKAPEEDSEEEDEEEQDGVQKGEAPWDPRDAAIKLAVLIEMYSLSLPRIKTVRPLKFLTPALESLLPAILDLILEGAFRDPGVEPVGPPAPEEEDSARGLLALRLFEAVVGFVETFVKGSWLETTDEDFRPMGHVLLSSLLEDSTGLLHPFLPSSNLASEFFYSRFPRLRPPPGRTRVGNLTASETEKADVEKVWRRVDALLPPLRIFSQNLPTLCASRLSATPSRIGAFVLLVHNLALSGSSTSISPSFSSPLTVTPGELISKTLSVLKMPFESAVNRVGEDERLWWLWWGVERQVEEGKGEGFEEEVLFPLVELVSTLASLSPSPQTRYLSFRLLSRLVLRCVPSSPSASSARDGRETIQMMLLKSLVSEEETPFEQLRVAAVGLVKEVMGEKLNEADQPSSDSSDSTAPPSLFLTPLFLSEFSSALFTLPFSLPPTLTPTPTSSSAEEQMSAEDFVEQQFPAAMERLGLYYFLLRRDKRNLTGLSSPSTLSTHERTLLAPLRSQLSSFLSAPPSADIAEVPGVRLQVEVVRDMVGRVDEAVAELRGRGGM